jgi:hypothetical protein
VKKKLIIIADRQSLSAYNQITDDLATPATRIEKIDTGFTSLQPDPAGASDDDGCFPGVSMAGQSTAMKHGEPHGRKTEKKKRELKNLAEMISHIVSEEDCDIWNLAIPGDQAQQVIDQLPIAVQQKLTKLKKGDFTWLPTDEVGGLFAN